jgi:hypothetical protein
MILLQFKLQLPMDLDAFQAFHPVLGVNPAPPLLQSCIFLLGLT